VIQGEALLVLKTIGTVGSTQSSSHHPTTRWILVTQRRGEPWSTENLPGSGGDFPVRLQKEDSANQTDEGQRAEDRPTCWLGRSDYNPSERTSIVRVEDRHLRKLLEDYLERGRDETL